VIARKCIFGADVMVDCTPTVGGVTGKALPEDGMNCLKKEMFKLFPQYHSCPEQFEPLWQGCKKSVEQCCGHLHKAKTGVTGL